MTPKMSTQNNTEWCCNLLKETSNSGNNNVSCYFKILKDGFNSILFQKQGFNISEYKKFM